MIKIKHLDRYLLSIFICFTILVVLYCIACYWSHSPHGFQTIYSQNDFLQVPVITNHLLYKQDKLANWVFAETPYFFPDIIISYIISLFNANIIENILIYAVIQTLYLLLIIGALLKLITQQSAGFRIGILFTLLVFLLSPELIGANAGEQGLELFSAMLMSSQHFGATVMVLTSLYLFMQICLRKKYFWIITFFSFTVIAILSDLIVGFYLTIPLLITVAFCRLLRFITPRSAFKLIALLFLTTLCGYLLYKYIPLNYRRSSTFIYFKPGNIHNFLSLIVNFCQKSPIIALIWLQFLFFAPISLIKTFIQEGKQLNPQMQWINFILLWMLIMTVWAVPAFIITDHNLVLASDRTYLGLRHLQSLILCPVLLGFPLLIYKHTHLFDVLTKKFNYSVALFVIMMLSLMIKPKLNQANLLTYYPPTISCLDSYAKKLNLHAGLTSYWQSKPLMYFNHSGIKIAPVNVDNLKPFLILSSLQYYTGDQFDFILMKASHFVMNKEKILSSFGKPTTIFTCPSNDGGYEFYAYTNHAMKGVFSELSRRKV